MRRSRPQPVPPHLESVSGLSRSIPRILALLGILPFILGLGWLLFIVTAKSLDQQNHWLRATARSQQPPSDGIRTLSLEYGAKRWEVRVRDKGDWARFAPGETRSVLVHPMDPQEISTADTVSLWANPLFVGFFWLAAVGCFVFLWRSQAPASTPLLPELLPGQRGRVDQPISNRATSPPDPSRPLLLRYSPLVAKAKRVWAALLAIFGLLAVIPSLDGELLALVFAALAWAGAGLLFFQSLQKKAYEIRAEARHIQVLSRSGTRLIQLHDIAAVREIPAPSQPSSPPTAYDLLDKDGQTLLRLDGSLLPEEDLYALLARVRHPKR